MAVQEVVRGGCPEIGIRTARGACYFCGTSPQGAWVVTNMVIEWEGRIVICEACAKEFGHSAGLVDPDAYEALQTEYVEVCRENSELKEKAEAWETLEGLVKNVGLGGSTRRSTRVRGRSTHDG